MKRFLIAFAVAFIATPASAQISGPNVVAGSIGRYDDEGMRQQLELRREREANVGEGEQTGGVNANGERLICRRPTHDTYSRLARPARICLTAQQWRRRR